MCNFLLIGLAKGVAPERRQHGLFIDPIAAASLPGTFPPDLDAFFVTDGHCSCELVVTKQTLRDRAAAYKKKGWSEAKIQRALAQAEAADGKHARNPGLALEVKTLLRTHVAQSGRLAFAYFMTKGDPVDDVPTSTRHTSLAELTSDDFVPTDELLLIEEPTPKTRGGP